HEVATVSRYVLETEHYFLRLPQFPICFSRCLSLFHFEGIDLLGADVANKEGRPVRSNAAPVSPNAEKTTKIFQAQQPLCSGHSESDTTISRIIGKQAVEIYIFAVARPAWKPDRLFARQPLRPLLNLEIEEQEPLGIQRNCR